MKKLMIIFSIFALAAIAAGQNYSPRPAGDKREVVRMHVALSLLNGKWNAAQKEVLIAAIDGNADQTAELLFTPAQARDIFYRIGTRDISLYREVFNLPVLADKKHYVLGLRPAERADVWRTHFAWIFANRKLTREQQDYLISVSEALSDPSGLVTGHSSLITESESLFDRELGRETFATIGPYKETGKFCGDASAKPAAKSLTFDCVCNLNGSNWSCYDNCVSGSGCTAVDGCGFLWMFKCNGNCRTDPPEGQ